MLAWRSLPAAWSSARIGVALSLQSPSLRLGAVGRVTAAQEIHLCRDIVVGL
jgi:hypothetical protein